MKERMPLGVDMGKSTIPANRKPQAIAKKVTPSVRSFQSSTWCNLRFGINTCHAINA